MVRIRESEVALRSQNAHIAFAAAAEFRRVDLAGALSMTLLIRVSRP